MKAKTAKTVVAALCIAAIVVVVWLYGSIDPEKVRWFPKCIFLSLTGWRCPGCGSQRAVHQLLHLNFAAAFRYNALFTCALPLLILILVSELLKDRWPGLRRAFQNPYFGWSIVVITILWWILRNIFGW